MWMEFGNPEALQFIIQWVTGYLGALTTYMNVVGASGAIAGLLSFEALSQPNYRILNNSTIKVKHIVILMLIGDVVGMLSPIPTGVAHSAHIGGMITGAILFGVYKLVLYFRNKKK